MKFAIALLSFQIMVCGGSQSQVTGFVPVPTAPRTSTATTSLLSSKGSSDTGTKTRPTNTAKEELLGLLGRKPSQRGGIVDPVLADPETKLPIRIVSTGTIFGDNISNNNNNSNNSPSQSLAIRSSTNQYEGSSATFINLLEPKKKTTGSSDDNNNNNNNNNNNPLSFAVKQITPFIPPQLRFVVAASSNNDNDEYIPMRDLFTSPAVSYAYERGWRQGFAQAGFPGPDKEFVMAKEYFAPAIAESSVIVDMSCATGLFTRRFAKEDRFDRVLGCDYSESMLTEARRRIRADSKLSDLKNTRLDLVRLDVGKIPIQNGTIDALHAGAAMHCWPDLEAAMSEIYRVLKPDGGRYFATTFLSQYFSTLEGMNGAASSSTPSQQAFQYFRSVDDLKKLVEGGGFESDKINIEVLGAACVVIRAEK